jgi:soluble lytic murein transglycosylase-like protein
LIRFVAPFIAAFAAIVAITLAGGARPAFAGNQMYEPMAASVRTALSRAIAESASSRLVFADAGEGYRWLLEMSGRLERRIPDYKNRVEFLKTVQYEATRAGLDPQLVLGLIQVESGFRQYAVSSASARGFMQVMPFWVDVIGERGHNLFDMRLNIRYGCVILRHYLDIEQGNLFRALGRYNGSLGRAEYPNLVMGAWRQWMYEPQRDAPHTQTTSNDAKSAVPLERRVARNSALTPESVLVITPTTRGSTAAE